MVPLVSLKILNCGQKLFQAVPVLHVVKVLLGLFGRIFLTSPVRTFLGPTSTQVSTPAVFTLRMSSAQRTGLVSYAPMASRRVSGFVSVAAVALR